MKLLKWTFKRITKIFNFLIPTEEQKKEYAERKEAHYNSRLNETTYNPSTGLPMIGAHDSNGNMYGSSASEMFLVSTGFAMTSNNDSLVKGKLIRKDSCVIGEMKEIKPGHYELTNAKIIKCPNPIKQ